MEPERLTKRDETDYVTEMCPHCENEIDMCWDVGQMGYQAWCPVCGNRLMLCSECAGQCDYDSTTDRCRMQNRQGGKSS